MLHAGICNGFEFDAKSGPFFVVDIQDDQLTHWIRTRIPLRRAKINIAVLSQQYCTGYCQLSENVTLPCPQRKIISERFKVCWHCFKLTGFNPAFHILEKSALSTAQLHYNNKPHYVYLAAFGKDLIKVGIACHVRLFQRLTEQGARLATVVDLLPDAYQARKLEETLQSVFVLPDRVTRKSKIKAIITYEKEQTRQYIECLKNEIISKSSIKNTFPYVYDLDDAYTTHNSFVGSSIEWIRLSRQHDTALSGYFYAMIGGFLFLQQPDQTLAAIDIHRYLGNIQVYVRHTN
ncbi:MAG: DUF2797 domain-containing protein [Amoebophilaceae bacterium]|jgi:hypothetical protein|nr:DUF2797 domain-containing protein [Amoebophilaceae bacterium]